MSKISERRSRTVINPPLQKRIVVAVSAIPILTLAVTTAAAVVMSSRVLDEAQATSENLPSLMPMLVAMFGMICAAGGTLVIQALRFSHRIAGPMHRIVESMRRVRAGDRAFRVDLRRDDELQEIAGELNTFFDWIDEQRAVGALLEADVDAAARDRGELVQ